MNEPLQELRSAVTRAAADLGSNGGAASSVRVERPKRDGPGRLLDQHGDAPRARAAQGAA